MKKEIRATLEIKEIRVIRVTQAIKVIRAKKAKPEIRLTLEQTVTGG